MMNDSIEGVSMLGERSLASLKYFVEHGHPSPGTASELGPAGC